MIPHNTLAVFRFELRRTLTASRIGVWLLLVLFPVFIIGVMKVYESDFQGGAVGRPTEPVIELDGEKGRVQIKYRDGRRWATIQRKTEDGVQEYRDVPIPNTLSRSEIRQCVDDLVEEHTKQDSAREGPDRRKKVDDTVWGWILLGLIPGVTALLGLLLWSTPIVQAELEGRTWIYLAVRPRGRASVLLGKYLTSITWTALAGWTSLTICVWIAQPVHALRLWIALFIVIGLACAAYGALYALIGVCVQRRAMVIAVAYTLIIEFLVSFVPAVINQFTVLFRLRNLFVDFMQWRPLFSKEASQIILSEQPAWLHILILFAFTIVLLVASVQVIQRKEYATADDA